MKIHRFSSIMSVFRISGLLALLLFLASSAHAHTRVCPEAPCPAPPPNCVFEPLPLDREGNPLCGCGNLVCVPVVQPPCGSRTTQGSATPEIQQQYCPPVVEGPEPEPLVVFSPGGTHQ
jgi:hypothetical protein